MPRNHVYPDPDGTNNATAPSSVPLDAASLVAGTVSVGAAVAGGSDAGFFGFLIPSSMAATASSTLPLVTYSISPGYLWTVIGFGALSVILGTINLFWGLARKKKWQERMRAQQTALDNVCTTANVFAD